MAVSSGAIGEEEAKKLSAIVGDANNSLEVTECSWIDDGRSDEVG
jgi:hypothetical protein